MANWLKNNELLVSSREKLLNWFELNKRNLPWRKERTAYTAWISEIIFQQTRIDQGLSYYNRFVKRFKSLEELAAADEDEVLKLWEGLGYYSRARNLHYSAKQIAINGFPTNFEEWKDIKGVGPYTAAAISSTVNNEAVAAIDGNVQRVISRLTDLAIAVNETMGIKKVNQYADVFLDKENPGDFNEAIMELGALVCTPKNPKCKECPLASVCVSLQKNTISNRPVKIKKVKVRDRYLHFYVVQHNGSFLIERRDKGEIWEGLYQFPIEEVGHQKANRKSELFKKYNNADWIEVFSGKHILSHQRLFITFWYLDKPVSIKEHSKDNNWIHLNELENYSFPRPLQRFIREYLLPSRFK